MAYNKKISICGSELLQLEIMKMKDAVKRARVGRLYSITEGNILLNKEIETMAEKIRLNSHIKLFETGYKARLGDPNFIPR